MPVPLIAALILAFGLDLPTVAAPLERRELAYRLLDATLGLGLVALVAGLSGMAIRGFRRRLDAFGLPAEWVLFWSSRLVEALGIAVFAWTMVVLDWPRVVAWGLRLERVAFAEQVALLAPFLLGQIVTWIALYPAEAALRPGVEARGLPSLVWRRLRMSLGTALPIAAFYALGKGLLRPGPGGGDPPPLAFLGAGAAALTVFLLSPLFVRLAWPTRRMPPGALRDRLERLAVRLKFRCTDILVWDTQGQVVNACVTGAVPWFRYVLISDRMITLMEEEKIEAIFGHEVGHVSHRHLPFFAAFCLGSMGLGMLAGEGLIRAWDYEALFARLFPDGATAEVVEGALTLGAFALYFFVVFGLLSRRMERQADLAGCLAVSCDRPDCPPHRDPNASDTLPPAANEPCAGSLEIFAEALAEVALFNGIPPSRHLWRHGSIAGRIAFVRSLEGRPDLVARFRRGTNRLRWAIALTLAAASLAAGFLADGASRGS